MFILQKIRKLILEIILKICHKNDKIKTHIPKTMKVCLKVIATDNELCVLDCLLIFRELLEPMKPPLDGYVKAEVYQINIGF